MAVYTVHSPSGPAAAVFVREAFSWPAFFLGPLWLAWRGLWLGLALWFVWAAVVAGAIWLLGLSGHTAWIILALGQTFLGLEAPDLARDRLARRRYRLVDIVVGDRKEEVETVFFRRIAPAASTRGDDEGRP